MSLGERPLPQDVPGSGSAVADSVTAAIQQRTGMPTVPGTGSGYSLDDQLDKLTKGLGQPRTPQQGGAQIPSPAPPKTYADVPQNRRANNTASGARTNSMMDLTRGVSNIIKEVKKKHDEKEQRKFQDDVERVAAAQSALATLDKNSQDPAVQQAIKINNQIIDDVLSDPKKLKRIEKGLDIHLTDPEKNSKESATLTKGIQAVKDGKSIYAKQRDAVLNRLQGPVSMQDNPNWKAAQELAKSGFLISPKDIYKAQTELDKMIIRGHDLKAAAKLRADATIGARRLQIEASKELEAARNQHNLDRDKAKDLSAMARLAYIWEHREKLAHLGKGQAVSNKRLQADSKLTTMLDDNIKTAQAQLEEANKKIKDASRWYEPNAINDGMKAAQTDITKYQQRIDDLRAMKASILNDANEAAQELGSSGADNSAEDLADGYKIDGEEDEEDKEDASEATDAEPE